MDSREKEFLQFTAQTSTTPMMLDIDRGEGICLFDQSGKKYYDLISGICVSNLGHGNQTVNQAIINQLNKSQHIMVYGEYVQEAQLNLAKKLSTILPKQLSTTYFVNSGTESIEASMKLAKRYTGRHEIIACRNSYHGSTQGSLSLMSNSKYSHAFRPLLPNIGFIEFNNMRDLSKITEKTAGVVIDLVQGANGYQIIDLPFLKGLRERCTETSTLLIFDEIQTGIGRTGSLFAFEHFDVVPDVICLAKAFGGGLPLGAFISSHQIMSTLTTNPMLGHITTFGGNPVSCAASLATIEYIETTKLLDTISSKSEQFVSLLKHPAIMDVRGLGLLLAIEFGNQELTNQVFDQCLTNGAILGRFLLCDTALRLTPPLTITGEEITEVCNLLLKSLNEVV